MGQDIFDVIIVLVLTAFAARGFWTGFVGEVAGLISIVGGFWVSHHFHTVLAPHLTFITEPAWRNIASYVLLFLGVLIAGPRACCSAPWSCCCCKSSSAMPSSCAIRAPCPTSIP